MRILALAVVFCFAASPAVPQQVPERASPASRAPSPSSSPSQLSPRTVSVSAQGKAGEQSPAEETASESAAPQQSGAPANPAVSIPEGTSVALALTAPVWSKSAKEGDSVYAAVAFPVALGGRMLIPTGTYVRGTIDAITRPTWHSNHAEFLIHFTSLIYANGYVVPLAGTPASSAPNAPNIAAAAANAFVDVNSRSDILLNNGSQLEMVFQRQIALDPRKTAAAARLAAESPSPSASFSATLCRPTPGTPGTPDTVMPGTPGTPGTPPTVIPGGPGFPPTVIPGTPPTPGTPDTVIPGTPGFPGVACPGPPMVASHANASEAYSGSFVTSAPLRVAGKELPPGSYQVKWIESGPTAEVTILQKGKVVLSVQARMKMLEARPSQGWVSTRTNADNTLSLASLEFGSQMFALFFE